MSEASVRPLAGRASGATARAIATRVLADLDELVATIGVALRDEIPEYESMTPAQMTEDVLPVTRRVVTSFFDAVVSGAPVGARVVKSFEESGRARLEMGVPLESMLHAYRIAGRVTWTKVTDVLRPGEEHLLAGLAAQWMDYIDLASSAVAKAYMSASAARLRSLDARRRELVEALLTATDPGEVAAVSLRFSTILAAAYVPVLVSGAGVAGRIDALLATAPARTLGGHRGDRVLLLVPDALRDAAPLLGGAPGALLAYGLPAAPGEALLAEVGQVEALLEAAVAEGRTAGAYGPDDLLVEQLLLGNERVAAALRRRVRDLLVARDPGGAIVATLRSYLATGSVPETARREVVHANTVAYRLGRVRDLTGLDPRVPVDAVLLVLGLGIQ
ncbi:MAG TPA: helix-turn-helix domain-containing protein [Mycobacteriales bacterium]|nr:helix-turn-helix domain-containing protein [Mycobacteriales bacterium]